MLPIIHFVFNDTETTEIYTLSLHDALPIFDRPRRGEVAAPHLLQDDADLPTLERGLAGQQGVERGPQAVRSEEHTSELQSPDHLVCRLLREKKTGELVDYCVGGMDG